MQTPRHQLGDIRLYPELTGVQHSVAQDNGWIIFPRASPRPSISKSPSQEHSQDCCDRSQCIPTFSLGTVPSHLLSEFQSPGPSGFDPGEGQGQLLTPLPCIGHPRQRGCRRSVGWGAPPPPGVGCQSSTSPPHSPGNAFRPAFCGGNCRLSSTALQPPADSAPSWVFRDSALEPEIL